MLIAIHGSTLKEDNVPYVRGMLEWLQAAGVQTMIHAPLARLLDKKKINAYGAEVYDLQGSLSKCNYVLTIGGDGTLLDALTYIGADEIPVLGINAGRLGFLASTAREQIIPSLEALLKNEFFIEERSLIRLVTEKDYFNGINFALNEFAILKRDTGSMIIVHTYLNGEFLNSYWADGLIVSTPTGSTGYSLSVGGPVVIPGTDNFIISPVSPHNLNVRPLLIPDTDKLTFEVEGRSRNVLLSLDSRSSAVPITTKMSLEKERFVLKLINTKKNTFITTLRNKLNWGFDSRN